MISIACLMLALGVNAQGWILTDAKRLSGTVNQTESEESSPVFSVDGTRLYFVRLFNKQNSGGAEDQDVWFSDVNPDGSYPDGQLAKEFNNKFNNAVVGFNKAGDAVYLLNTYDGKKDLEKGISRSEFDGEKWSKPEKVEIPTLNIEGDFYGFFVSDDESTMIISYAGIGSLGNEDLYVSEKENGVWSSPKHMGATINSAGYEISPFLSPGKDTLFFSTDGRGGEGDADIFYSIRGNSWTDWSVPVNLGSQINSSKFDAYFIKKEDQLFWSSNRDNIKSDLFTMTILPPAPIELAHNKFDVTEHGNKDGSIELIVNGGVAPFNYQWSNGSKSKSISELETGDYTVVVTDAAGQEATSTISIFEPELVLPPVVVVDPERLDFVHYFGYNQNRLKVDRGDLRKFVRSAKKQLDDGKQKITFVITASASNVPTTSFASNEKLAEARGNNLKYDLVNYFGRKKLSDKVVVVVNETKVQGPDYQDDPQEKDKYRPFQYVEMVTE